MAYAHSTRVLCGAPDVDTHAYWNCEACQLLREAAWHERAQKRFWQQRAGSRVGYALKTGALPRLDGSILCVDCGDVAREYDHRDYAEPLVVEPVCHSCNIRRGSAEWPKNVSGIAA